MQSELKNQLLTKELFEQAKEDQIATWSINVESNADTNLAKLNKCSYSFSYNRYGSSYSNYENSGSRYNKEGRLYIS